MGVLIVIVGVFAGAGMLFSIHRYSPHEHFELGREGPATSGVSRSWRFGIAITLHNFPEGMAVGVGFAGGDITDGLILGIGIGVQNIPEGLAVAVSLLAIGYRKRFACRVITLRKRRARSEARTFLSRATVLYQMLRVINLPLLAQWCRWRRTLRSSTPAIHSR